MSLAAVCLQKKEKFKKEKKKFYPEKEDKTEEIKKQRQSPKIVVRIRIVDLKKRQTNAWRRTHNHKQMQFNSY